MEFRSSRSRHSGDAHGRVRTGDRGPSRWTQGDAEKHLRRALRLPGLRRARLRPLLGFSANETTTKPGGSPIVWAGVQNPALVGDAGKNQAERVRDETGCQSRWDYQNIEVRRPAAEVSAEPRSTSRSPRLRTLSTRLPSSSAMPASFRPSLSSTPPTNPAYKAEPGELRPNAGPLGPRLMPTHARDPARLGDSRAMVHPWPGWANCECARPLASLRRRVAIAPGRLNHGVCGAVSGGGGIRTHGRGSSIHDWNSHVSSPPSRSTLRRVASHRGNLGSPRVEDPVSRRRRSSGVAKFTIARDPRRAARTRSDDDTVIRAGHLTKRQGTTDRRPGVRRRSLLRTLCVGSQPRPSLPS